MNRSEPTATVFALDRHATGAEPREVSRVDATASRHDLLATRTAGEHDAQGGQGARASGLVVLGDGARRLAVEHEAVDALLHVIAQPRLVRVVDRVDLVGLRHRVVGDLARFERDVLPHHATDAHAVLLQGAARVERIGVVDALGVDTDADDLVRGAVGVEVDVVGGRIATFLEPFDVLDGERPVDAAVLVDDDDRDADAALELTQHHQVQVAELRVVATDERVDRDQAADVEVDAGTGAAQQHHQGGRVGADGGGESCDLVLAGLLAFGQLLVRSHRGDDRDRLHGLEQGASGQGLETHELQVVLGQVREIVDGLGTQLVDDLGRDFFADVELSELQLQQIQGGLFVSHDSLTYRFYPALSVRMTPSGPGFGGVQQERQRSNQTLPFLLMNSVEQ